MDGVAIPAVSMMVTIQVLSYGDETSMPSGLESTLPGTVLRGVYVVSSPMGVDIVVYDPRGPLDAMEVQDAVPDMYRWASLHADQLPRRLLFHRNPHCLKRTFTC
jgi:hypothetical protein